MQIAGVGLYWRVNMHKTFISYHHDNEQEYKEDIIKEYGEDNFIDKSVGDGEIDTDLDESRIMEIIRTDYLQDSTVTLVLVGSETAKRPFVNSEIQASLRDTKNNKHNGLLAVVIDEIYDLIYTTIKCSCGCEARTKSAFYDIYLPDLVKKNNQKSTSLCHYNDSEVYCAVIKYSDFIVDPEKYINSAFNKRDDSKIEIFKTLDKETPKISK